MTGKQELRNDAYVNGGEEESGSSNSGPNGSGYSKKKSFNLNQGTSTSAINTQTLSTNTHAGTTAGGNAGTNWSMSGGQASQGWAKGFRKSNQTLTDFYRNARTRIPHGRICYWPRLFVSFYDYVDINPFIATTLKDLLDLAGTHTPVPPAVPLPP